MKLTDSRNYTGFIRDITERKRLEKEILEISEREQRRIGQDLHDGLCQHLAGIEMLGQVLAQKLAAQPKEISGRAVEITKALRDAIGQTRLLARGLSPVTLETDGLMSALAELALNTTKMFRVNCSFHSTDSVQFPDNVAATHLFRIVQEAISNAIKHGQARNISIQLAEAANQVHLQVSDDGMGFSKKLSPTPGMGLRIMQSRTGMVGGTILIEQPAEGGTVVKLTAPKHSQIHGGKKYKFGEAHSDH